MTIAEIGSRFFRAIFPPTVWETIGLLLVILLGVVIIIVVLTLEYIMERLRESFRKCVFIPKWIFERFQSLVGMSRNVFDRVLNRFPFLDPFKRRVDQLYGTVQDASNLSGIDSAIERFNPTNFVRF